MISCKGRQAHTIILLGVGEGFACTISKHVTQQIGVGVGWDITQTPSVCAQDKNDMGLAAMWRLG